MTESPMAGNTVSKGAGDLLGKKYGPLPFGAWLVIVAGTAYFARKLIKGQQAANTAAAAQDSTGGGLVTVGGGVPFGSGGLTDATTNTNNTPVTPPTEITNQPWLTRAAAKLAAGGLWNPLDVQRALQTYISGQPLDSRQSAIVNQAISAEGQPPIPIVPGGPAGGGTNATLNGIVYRAGHAGIFARYSDGTLRWIYNPIELKALTTGNANLNLPKVTLPSSDPAFNTADYGPGGYAVYKASENANAKRDPKKFNTL